MIKKLQSFISLNKHKFYNRITLLVKKNKEWLNKNFFNPVKLILLGVLIAYLGQLVMDFFYRPKIDIEWSNLCLYKTFDDKWIINSNIKITNTGKEKTALRVQEILFSYTNPKYNKVSIPIDATFSIEGNNSYKEEIYGVFHNDFDTLTQLPDFVSAELFFERFRKNHRYRIFKDSSDIGWSFALGGANEKTESIGFKEEKIIEPLVNPDTLSNDMFGVYELFYKDRSTKFLYYPKNHPIKHEIEKEKVFIYPVLSGSFNESDKSMMEYLPAQYFFRSQDKELLDNLNIPTKMSFIVQTRDLIDNETVINESEISMKGRKACLYYLFTSKNENNKEKKVKNSK